MKTKLQSATEHHNVIAAIHEHTFTLGAVVKAYLETERKAV